MAALSVEGANALLHAGVKVDESTADAATVVEAELRFADAVAAQFEFAVFDEVVGAQVRQASAERGFADGIAVDHPLGAQLMVFAVAGLFEVVEVGGDLRAVFALAVGVAERPPAPRQAVIEHGVTRGVLMVGHRIVTTA
ncbi:hypothetical protein D3C81_1448940 [compost metagenome]